LTNLTPEQLYEQIISILTSILGAREEAFTEEQGLVEDLNMTDAQIKEMQEFVDLQFDTKIPPGVWSGVSTIGEVVDAVKDFS
jgi:acyl carrier protein